MTDRTTTDPALAKALGTVFAFIREVTGVEPTPAEVADALTRYFVLNEIRDHILMLREGTIDGQAGDQLRR